MCPKQTQSMPPTKQQGISLPVILFILIVIGLLAAALARVNSQSTAANAQQVIATRAFFAAETGAQQQALAVFPVSGGAGSCSNQTFNYSTGGLAGCRAVTTCNQISLGGESFYQVTSQGQCNTGQPLQATRTIEIRLRSLN